MNGSNFMQGWVALAGSVATIALILTAFGLMLGMELAVPGKQLVLDAMAETGAVDEATALMQRGLDPRLPAMKAVGLRELAAHATGGATLEEAIAAAQQATRRYAKRQLTWFRNQTPDWPRIAATEAEEQWVAFQAFAKRPTAAARPPVQRRP